MDIRDAPSSPEFVNLREGCGPRFILTVDTEEEFDWRAPLTRDQHGVATLPALATFQRFCEDHGVVPIYLVDYPVAVAPQAAEALGEAIAAGRAEVGVQLHPWVSPPFEEEVCERNSYAGNLPEPLERAKFTRLRDAIEGNLGARPLIYRAGRYGVGPNTAAILSDCGIVFDTSVRAHFDYGAAGGANYRHHPLRPYWLDRARGLVELPLTTVFWGPLRRLGRALYPLLWRLPRLRGVLSRLGLLERIPLTPEGTTAAEAIRGIDTALADGLPVLVLSFHSPSVAPGHTPYVRDEADLAAFYDWWRQVFAHLARRGVAPSSVADLTRSLALA